ncbi:hypothetical protein [Prauserella endophytica]|uniref:Uncharacterized protein n=1 Tax=Prauserella endophytica TaxID=1592324 RepID=A0ABY2S009_9PSEU|nr:hypothetical protein [Prauserella endophytica]PXY20357.1 hypothetical protein BAY59_31460 [Prauserella coralliicola]TKG66960.1 hypothetical protein FCN18_23910 [Prauserella endophytica]
MHDPERAGSEHDRLTAAALRKLGRLAIVLAELDGPAYRYQRSTQTLWVDPRVDIVGAVRQALIDLLPVERELVVIPGGAVAEVEPEEEATACGLIPTQAADEDESGGARRLCVVPARPVLHQ